MTTLTLAKPSYKEIPLTNSDHFTIVDAQDYDYFNQWQWSLTRGATKRPLIVRYYKHRRQYYLHKEIASLYEDFVYSVGHINGNSLDNRRENLQIKVRPPSLHERSEITGNFSDLTPTQKKVARFVYLGLSNQEIADELFVTRRTVESHITGINTAVGTNNRTEIAFFYQHREKEQVLEYVPPPLLPKKLKAIEQLKGQRLVTAQMLIDAKDALSIQIEQLQQVYEQLDATLRVMKP